MSAKSKSAAILFVDDDPTVLEAIRRTLATESFDVLTVSSADDALGTLASRPIDVIVSDESMPRMTGGELLAIAAERYPDVLRIMLTGRPSLESAQHAINVCRVYRYLTKPIDPAELPAILREAIKKRKRIAMTNERELERLSVRERDVLRLISRGLRVKDTAERLGVSPHTVRNHLKSIFRKLDAHSQAELVVRFGPKGT
ncbi:MAG TPA: response regulator transcription factor [Polyangiaceae bacterium]|nr:response regulator transcription factor [Polyangiaceae bacterium]